MARRTGTSRKRKLSIQKLRRRWTRRPTQKAHSTKKGLKGYDRGRDGKQTRGKPGDDGAG